MLFLCPSGGTDTNAEGVTLCLSKIASAHQSCRRSEPYQALAFYAAQNSTYVGNISVRNSRQLVESIVCRLAVTGTNQDAAAKQSVDGRLVTRTSQAIRIIAHLTAKLSWVWRHIERVINFDQLFCGQCAVMAR